MNVYSDLLTPVWLQRSKAIVVDVSVARSVNSAKRRLPVGTTASKVVSEAFLLT